MLPTVPLKKKKKWRKNSEEEDSGESKIYIGFPHKGLHQQNPKQNFKTATDIHGLILYDLILYMV